MLQEVLNVKRADFSLTDSFLIHGVQLCIPESSLCEEIIRELHGEGHFDRDKTLALVSKDFYWLKLKWDMMQYMVRCYIC